MDRAGSQMWPATHHIYQDLTWSSYDGGSPYSPQTTSPSTGSTSPHYTYHSSQPTSTNLEAMKACLHLETAYPRQIPSHLNSGQQFAFNHDYASRRESLDPAFRPRRRTFFVVGRVFMTPWVEPTSSLTTTTSTTSSDAETHNFFTKIRRFVVIREGPTYCTALPILTYGGRGVSKPGVRKECHAIVHTTVQAPKPSPSEYGLQPFAIRVTPDSANEHLDNCSRLNYGKVYTVEHNVKVKPVGRVHPGSLGAFSTTFEHVWLGNATSDVSDAELKAGQESWVNGNSIRWTEEAVRRQYYNKQDPIAPKPTYPDEWEGHRSSTTASRSFSDLSLDNIAHAADNTTPAETSASQPQTSTYLTHSAAKPITDPASFTSEFKVQSTLYGSEKREFKERILNYRVRSRGFFTVGRVFKIVWTEPAVETSSVISNPEADHRALSSISSGGKAWSRIRRFVVIREGDTYCSALPIKTYSGRGVAMPHINKSEHAIIYTGKKAPTPSANENPRRGEEPMRHIAIRVDPDSPVQPLDPMSRIHFAAVHTINHHLKVCPFGMVRPDSIPALKDQFLNVWNGSPAAAAHLGTNHASGAKAAVTRAWQATPVKRVNNLDSSHQHNEDSDGSKIVIDDEK